MNIYYSKEPVNFILLQHNSILYSVVGPSLSPSLISKSRLFLAIDATTCQNFQSEKKEVLIITEKIFLNFFKRILSMTR